MQIKKGEIITGKVTGITKYGAFVSIAGEAHESEAGGMIHISEISDGFIQDINEFLEINQTVKAVVLGVNENGKLALSLKQMPKKPPETSRNFEDMMNKFKRDSDEKMSDLHIEPKKSGAPRRRKD